MKRLEQRAVLVRLIERLNNKGRGCNEVYIQRAVYVIQSLCRVNLDFSFVLYKYGPFSFDLQDELTICRADGLLSIETHAVVGATFAATELGRRLMGRFSVTNDFTVKFEELVTWVSECSITQLDKLSTAIYVIREMKTGSQKDKARRLLQVNPQISAVEVDEILSQTESKSAEFGLFCAAGANDI